ncbi:MAG TPA: hypothetical protein VIJ61_01500 [Thermoanaerobaculia bacterium]
MASGDQIGGRELRPGNEEVFLRQGRSTPGEADQDESQDDCRKTPKEHILSSRKE